MRSSVLGALACICLQNLASAAPPRLMPENVRLLLDGGFEITKATLDAASYPAGVHATRSALPRGWLARRSALVGEWALDRAAHAQGDVSLRMAPMTGPLVVESAPVAVERGVRRADVSILRRGEAGSAVVRWLGVSAVLREDPLVAIEDRDGWTRLASRNAAVPAGARWMSIALTVPSSATVWWDDARATGVRMNPAALRVLVNQVGYDAGAPKRFTVQANFEARAARFEVIGAEGKVVYRGELEPKARIIGAHNSDWGNWYWRGSFDNLNTTGRYRVRVTLDGRTDTSWPFSIGHDLVACRTARPAWRFFYYQRCGIAIPGYHKACHLDDASNKEHSKQFSLAGGWHDAGDYNKYHNAPYVFGLARAYETNPRLFSGDDRNRNGLPDFVDEIVWGAVHVARMVTQDGSVPGEIFAGYRYAGPPELETDNLPGTGDERPVSQDSGRDPSVHVAALAKVARIAPGRRSALLAAAERGAAYAIRTKARTVHLFCGALDLYALTRKPAYAALARDLFPAVGLDDPVATAQYDALFHDDHSRQVRERLVKQANDLVALADPAFGIRRFGSLASPTYFNAPGISGTGGAFGGYNSEVISAATTAAQAYRLTGDRRYLTFAYDQLNWVFGNNPFAICMMEGAGSYHPPTYHQAQRFGGVRRGAIPGGIVNGITWRGPADDRPYFDLRPLDMPDFRTSEVWLPHNTHYLQAVATLAQPLTVRRPPGR